MINKLLIIFLLLNFQFTLAQEADQQIIPVEDQLDYYQNQIEITTGAYIKDVNNLLDPFTGTWTGVYTNKTYTFFITEVTMSLDDISKDLLLIRHKIVDRNNTVIVDTSSLLDGSAEIIEGMHFASGDSQYIAQYLGEEIECGESGYITLKPINNATQMDVYYIPERGIIIAEDCPNGAADHSFPITEHFTLTKQ